MLIRELCPACGGTGKTIYRCQFDEPPISTFLSNYYGRDLDIPGEYRAEKCTVCGTIWQAEVGELELLARLYGEWVDTRGLENDPAYRFDTANPTLSRDGHEIMAAAAYLGISLSDMVTLDYGMGWASWARNARDLGCQSYGFDLVPERLDFAERYGVCTSLGDQRFHFINTEQLLEHVTDPKAVVADLARRLRPGGILKVSTPSQLGLEATLRRLGEGQAELTHAEIMPLHPLEHVNCFTMRGLELISNLRPLDRSLRVRYAFLPGVSLRHPRKALKELARPLWRNPANLYVWLQKQPIH